MSPIITALMAVLDLEHAEAVADHRRVTMKKPLTEFAAKLLAKKFAACPDPNAAAEMMIEKCWQGFDPAWLAPRTAPNASTGARNVQHRPHVGDRLAAAFANIEARENPRPAYEPDADDWTSDARSFSQGDVTLDRREDGSFADGFSGPRLAWSGGGR